MGNMGKIYLMLLNGKDERYIANWIYKNSPRRDITRKKAKELALHFVNEWEYNSEEYVWRGE